MSTDRAKTNPGMKRGREIKTGIDRAFFSLVELLFAVAVALILMSVIVTFVVFTLREWQYLEVTADMRTEAMAAIESFKGDLAYSSPHEITLFPNGEDAQGLSFPIILRSDHTTMPMSGDEIGWTHTVVYHVFSADDGTHSLRRTIFGNRDNSLSSGGRLAQLQSVIYHGDGSRASNGANAATKTLAGNLKSYKLGKGSTLIDARQSGSDDPEMIHLGAMRLTSGKHTFRFEAADEPSTPQNIGIDALYVTPTGSQLEGEAFISRLTTSGGTASVDSPSPAIRWENNSQLLFSTRSPGAYVEMDIYNDMWMEGEFAQIAAETSRTQVLLDESSGQEVIGLAGMDIAWFAEQQVNDVPAERSGYAGSFLRSVILKDPNFTGGLAGERIQLQFSGAYLKNEVPIHAVYIMERSSGADGDAATLRQVRFGGSPGVVINPAATLLSDWVGLPYDPNKDYLVSMELEASAPDSLPAPQMLSGGTGTYRVSGWEIDRLDIGKVSAWSSLPLPAPLIIEEIPDFPLISGIFVSYPETGTYSSRIFDTTLTSVNYDWLYATVSNIPGGASVKIKIRTASQADMSGASDWSAITAYSPGRTGTSIGGFGSGRFVQFQAVITTVSPFTQSPYLHDVAITWDGPDRVADFGGRFTHGPDYGKFKVFLDGNLLNRVNAFMDFEISRMHAGKEIRRRFHVSSASHQVRLD